MLSLLLGLACCRVNVKGRNAPDDQDLACALLNDYVRSANATTTARKAALTSRAWNESRSASSDLTRDAEEIRESRLFRYAYKQRLWSMDRGEFNSKMLDDCGLKDQFPEEIEAKRKAEKEKAEREKKAAEAKATGVSHTSPLPCRQPKHLPDSGIAYRLSR